MDQVQEESGADSESSTASTQMTSHSFPSVTRLLGKKRSLEPVTAMSCVDLRDLNGHVDGAEKVTSGATNNSVNPSEYVRASFESNGNNPDEVTEAAQKSFQTVTEQMISSYQAHKLQYVRDDNLEKLRELVLTQGASTLDCCNRFGESLMHMACRRGRLGIIKFLVTECRLSLRVKDDFHRTPLHDACWTQEPQLELMDFLISQVPDLLLVPDLRGHTPFHYARREHWDQWMEFLCARKDRLTVPPIPILDE
jgi:Ankyrin repeats (3 copies)